MFAEGRADMAVLDRAVKRVLTEKFRMGLFEHPFGLEEEAFDAVSYTHLPIRHGMARCLP